MSRHARLCAALATIGLAATLRTAHGEPAPTSRASDPGYVFALGPFDPEYAAPEPGTYSLPVIRRVRDHTVVEAGGRETKLFDLKGKRLAIIAFVYLSCAESTGCPLSLAVLHRLDHELASDAKLASQVSLVTVSFDPDRDTPTRLAEIRALHQPKSDWRFATTTGDAQLAPLLADFDQQIAKLRYPDGRWSGLFRHVLKVFLLDGDNRVRNVYSVGFLNAELVLADVKTLLMKER